MPELHWFDVTLQTPMRQIGWVWVLLVLGIVFLVMAVSWLIRDWRDLGRGEGDYARRDGTDV